MTKNQKSQKNNSFEPPVDQKQEDQVKNTGDSINPQEDFLPEEMTQEQFAEFIASVAKLVKEKEELDKENQNLKNAQAVWEKQKEESTQQYDRLLADFDNFRRRNREAAEDLKQTASADLILKILPVVDNLERALAIAPNDDGFTKGVDLVYRQIVAILATCGVTEMEALGADFNPELHEAVWQEAAGKENQNKVIVVVLKGYLLNEKLLRPAMVKVGI